MHGDSFHEILSIEIFIYQEKDVGIIFNPQFVQHVIQLG